MNKLLIALILLPVLSLAQGKDSAPVELEEAQVIARPIDLFFIPSSVHSILPEKNAPVLNFTSALNLLPGVSSQAGAANTAKFSYRGFGARSQYTTSRSLFYLDEIPITTLQGFSTFEDINPLYIGRARLISVGAVGSYPAVLGGVMKLETRPYPYFDESYEDAYANTPNEFRNTLTLGSFRLVSENFLYSNRDQELTVGYENAYQEGWRENSEFKRQSFFLNGKSLFKKNLQLLVYGIKNRAEIPSSISADNFENNPEKAADSWARIEGYEQYDKLMTGLTYSNRKKGFDPANTLYSITAFYQYRNGFEPRPFNILDDQSHHGGLRGSLVHRMDGRIEGSLQAFAEYHLGAEEASTFENKYDSLSGTYNNKGAPINNIRLVSQRVNSGVSFHSDVEIGDSIPNKLTYSLDLNVLYQMNSLNEGSRYGIPFQLAPQLELKYLPKENRKGVRGLELRNLVPGLSVYRSYSIPSLEENLDPDGSLNTGLEPEKAWTGEIGLSGIILWPHHSRIYEHHSIHWEADFYYSEVQNLIVPKVVGPDQVVATNSGSSRHAGLELSAGFGDYLWGRDELLDADRSAWKYSCNLNGYYGSFVYKDFADTTGTFSGNRLPGFPEWQLTFTGEIIYERYRKGVATRLPPLKNVSLGYQLQATGGYFINDQNTVRNEPFFLMQTWLAYQYVFEKHWMCSIKAGVKNLTDTHYAAMTVVNNQAFGNSQPRFYYPGEPVNWFSQLAIAYRF